MVYEFYLTLLMFYCLLEILNNTILLRILYTTRDTFYTIGFNGISKYECGLYVFHSLLMLRKIIC